MKTYKPWLDSDGNLLPAHECIMEKYFDHAGFGCCAERLAKLAQDQYGCRWNTKPWLHHQELESQMRLNWTNEPELTQAFGVEDCIQADERMLANAY